MADKNTKNDAIKQTIAEKECKKFSWGYKKTDEENSNHNGNKFYRRKDLFFEIRLLIAFTALLNKRWGTITQLAKKYAISRVFVYMLESRLYQCVETAFDKPRPINEHKQVITPKNEAIKNAIVFRLEGKCSIPAISEILKRLELPNNSVGFISQILNDIGSNLSATVETISNSQLYVYLASDELYSHCRPILISVEPISSAILKIDLAESRETSQWVTHFNELKAKGITIIKVISDEGLSLCSSTEQISIPRQPDTFHAISHRLGKWVGSLEKSAYAAIQDEYDRINVFESAKTEPVLQKKMEQYCQAKKRSEDAITLYDNYKFLYNCIIQELQVFDKEGDPRNRKEAEENIRVALDFMISLPIPPIKKVVNTIYNCFSDLLQYLDIAKQVIQRLITKGIEEHIIKAFALLWQYNKNRIKAKHKSRNIYFKTKYNQQIEFLKMILKDEFERIKKVVFDDLNTIIQSSAIVENINSIVRNFLNSSKNHVTQSMLNLLMFYHNHRRYKGGERKGKTPMEILTGLKQEKDWVVLLFEKVNPSFC